MTNIFHGFAPVMGMFRLCLIRLAPLLLFVGTEDFKKKPTDEINLILSSKEKSILIEKNLEKDKEYVTYKKST